MDYPRYTSVQLTVSLSFHKLAGLAWRGEPIVKKKKRDTFKTIHVMNFSRPTQPSTRQLRILNHIQFQPLRPSLAKGCKAYSFPNPFLRIALRKTDGRVPSTAVRGPFSFRLPLSVRTRPWETKFTVRVSVCLKMLVLRCLALRVVSRQDSERKDFSHAAPADILQSGSPAHFTTDLCSGTSLGQHYLVT